MRRVRQGGLCVRWVGGWLSKERKREGEYIFLKTPLLDIQQMNHACLWFDTHPHCPAAYLAAVGFTDLYIFPLLCFFSICAFWWQRTSTFTTSKLVQKLRKDRKRAHFRRRRHCKSCQVYRDVPDLQSTVSYTPLLHWHDNTFAEAVCFRQMLVNFTLFCYRDNIKCIIQQNMATFSHKLYPLLLWKWSSSIIV